jgi:hypothetical protein
MVILSKLEVEYEKGTEELEGRLDRRLEKKELSSSRAEILERWIKGGLEARGRGEDGDGDGDGGGGESRERRWRSEGSVSAREERRSVAKRRAERNDRRRKEASRREGREEGDRKERSERRRRRNPDRRWRRRRLFPAKSAICRSRVWYLVRLEIFYGFRFFNLFMRQLD